MITLHRDSQDVLSDVRHARRSTDTEQGVREPLLSPFAEQESPQDPQSPAAGSDIQW